MCFRSRKNVERQCRTDVQGDRSMAIIYGCPTQTHIHKWRAWNGSCIIPWEVMIWIFSWVVVFITYDWAFCIITAFLVFQYSVQCRKCFLIFICYAYSSLCILQAMLLFWGNLQISLAYNEVYEMLSSYLVLWGESNGNCHSFMLSCIYLQIVLPLAMTAHALPLGIQVLCRNGRSKWNVLLCNFRYLIHGSLIHLLCLINLQGNRDVVMFMWINCFTWSILSNFLMSW